MQLFLNIHTSHTHIRTFFEICKILLSVNNDLDELMNILYIFNIYIDICIQFYMYSIYYIDMYINKSNNN